MWEIIIKETLLVLLGNFVNYFTKHFFCCFVIISPKNKLINPKKDSGWRISYLVYIRNKSDKPYYDLQLKILARTKKLSPENLIIKAEESGGYKPTYPVSFGPKSAFKIDFGNFGFSGGKTKEGYSICEQMIHNIDPKKTMKFEIVLNNLSDMQPFRVEHQLKYSEKSQEIITKEIN